MSLVSVVGRLYLGVGDNVLCCCGCREGGECDGDKGEAHGVGFVGLGVVRGTVGLCKVFRVL